MRAIEALGLEQNGQSIVAFVGCGGKTTLIERLAESAKSGDVLIAPTTKMYPPGIQGADVLGQLNPKTKKLEAAPPGMLMRAARRYGVVLLEADGSRGLPCKGWWQNEPAVPEYCTHTAGVITLSAFGKPATEERVHRLPEFLSLTGLHAGDTIGLAALESMVTDPRGMFKNSAGRRIILVNRVEDEQTAALALRLLKRIREKHPGRFARMLYGSAYLDYWAEA